jgi:hypothetical protein
VAEARIGNAYRRLRWAANLPQLDCALAFEPLQAGGCKHTLLLCCGSRIDAVKGQRISIVGDLCQQHTVSNVCCAVISMLQQLTDNATIF